MADTDQRTETEASRGSVRRATVMLVVALLLLGGWWLTSARSLSSGGFGFSADLAVGEQLHVGILGIVDQDISVMSLHADVSDGLDGEFQVCHPRQGADSIGGVHDLDPFCSQVERAERGTSIPAVGSEGGRAPHLVLTLTATAPGEQWLCGIDVVYRSGVRFGWQRDLPFKGVFNAAAGTQSPCG